MMYEYSQAEDESDFDLTIELDEWDEVTTEYSTTDRAMLAIEAMMCEDMAAETLEPFTW